MEEKHKRFYKILGEKLKEARLKMGLSIEQMDEILRKPLSAEEEKRSQERMEEIGRRLRTAREALNLSLEQVAQQAGISATELSLIEKDAGDTGVATIMEIARAVKLTPEELFK